MGTTPTTALIGSIAAGQRRLITREQLLLAGFSRHQIHGRARSGLLTPVFRAVYLVGVPSLSHDEFLFAAHLHAGRTSQISHRTAGEVGNVLRTRLGVATISTPRRGLVRTVETSVPLSETGHPATLTIEHAVDLAPPFWVAGLPITPLPRMLVDVAAGRDGELVLGWAWDEAEYRGVLDLEAIAAEIERSARPGVPRVRAKLAAHRAVIGQGARADLRSRRELRLLHLMEAYGLPRPEVNVRVRVAERWSRPDFLWRLLGLALEFDGGGHDRPSVRAADSISDVECFVQELDVLRFETETTLADPRRHMELLRAALQRKADALGVDLRSLPRFGD